MIQEEDYTWAELRRCQINYRNHSAKTYRSRRNGYYETKKGGVIFYQSSYELRAATILDELSNVDKFMTQIQFTISGKKRIMDFLVKYNDDSYRIIEVKPFRKIKKCLSQITDNQRHAINQGFDFQLWTEKELGFNNEHAAVKWADQFISGIKSIDFTLERKLRNRSKAKKFYQNNISQKKMVLFCEFCKSFHEPLRSTYEKNINRNGRYICEREGGHIAGKKPKPKKDNPFACDGKKECSLCHSVLFFSNFSPDNTRRDGYCSRCKSCRNMIANERYRAKQLKTHAGNA